MTEKWTEKEYICINCGAEKPCTLKKFEIEADIPPTECPDQCDNLKADWRAES